MELVTLKEISIIFSIWVAVYGIDSWRREYVGKRKMELAEQILALFYQSKDIISYIRSPFSFGGEGSSRKKNEHETEEQTKLYNQAYIVFERYESNKDVFNKLKSLRYQLMALHGQNACLPFDDLNSIVHEIFGASRRLSRYWLQQGHNNLGTEEFKRHLEEMHKAEDIFWESGEEDPIIPKVEKAITDIESICKPIIESKGTLFGILNLNLFKKC